MNSTLIYFSYLFCILLGQAAFAQSNDSSVFFRYAATFDYLLPINGEPYTLAIPDSLAESVYNAPLKNAKLHKVVKMRTTTEKSFSEIDLQEERMEWDGEGRLTRHAFYLPGDDLSVKDTRINYLIGRKIFMITVRNEHENIPPDTLRYHYNRSGWVSGWKRHVIDIKEDSISTGTRLYDSRGRLIVATYMMYGPLFGAYTYEYNDMNKLVRRCFTTASGAILCTDTLIYANELNSVQLITHKLKIAGSDKWTVVETKTLSTYSGKILSYSDYNDADTSYFYRNLPSYNLTYAYDDKGRVASESFGNEITPTLITAEYKYGKYDQPDEITYSETVVTKKSTTVRVYSSDSRSYDEQGRIKGRMITTWLFEDKKKKSLLENSGEESIMISYNWE